MAEEKKSQKKVKPRSALYDGAKLKNRSCPKCGHGYLLAEHKDHRTCGKCGYVEAKK